MAQPLGTPYSYFTDANGLPLAGGKVYTYAAGTTTLQVSYTDSTGAIPASNPVILDSAGRATIWLSGFYKITVKDSADNLIKETDNITAYGLTGDMYKSIYDPANIQEQVVGLTAVQTLTNKTFTLSQLNGGALAGFRNRIINGGMQIDQRNSGASQTITAGAALAYTVDRWYAYCTGANVTGQKVAGSNYAKNRYQFTGASSVTGIGFGTRLEAANTYDLNNRICTLAVDLANSLLTTVTWTAYYANSIDAFGTLASPTRTQIATGTLTINSTVSRYYANISVPAAATTGIEIVFSVGAQISGAWTIGDIDLVAGSVSELWHEQRPIGTELSLCERYSQRLDSQSGIIATAWATSTTAFGAFFPFTTKMRDHPTGLTVGTVGSLSVINMANATIGALTGLTFANASDHGLFATGTVASGLTAGTMYHIRVDGVANLIVTGVEL